MIDLIAIALGDALYSLAMIGINIPSKLADGGVTGIALLLNNLFGFAPSITFLKIAFITFLIVHFWKTSIFANNCWYFCFSFLFAHIEKSSYTFTFCSSESFDKQLDDWSPIWN